LPRFLFLVRALVLAIGRGVSLLWTLLFRIETPRFIVVQNPPAAPTLLVAWIVARARSAKLVIDWHNFGCAMLALNVGETHPAVRLARWYERSVGRRADAHLCVSQAMQALLARDWHIAATVLYDRPGSMFAPCPPPRRREVLLRFSDVLQFPALGDATRRPALIVSPTSWTLDEDFSLLLDAAVRCDERIRRHEAFPHLLVVLTGQGPLRAHYERAMRRLTLQKVHLRTTWLASDDYPLLLGTADLGLCLHRSASGVDLPMKVADMFGAGVPVCALDYGPCLAERVRHGENGLVFSSAVQLAEQLCELFAGFPQQAELLGRLRRTVAEQRLGHWADGWKVEAQPVLSQL
jgi:beta-1,4-mannosyltransferase